MYVANIPSSDRQNPTPNPAANAAPNAVVSLIAGRTTSMRYKDMSHVMNYAAYICIAACACTYRCAQHIRLDLHHQITSGHATIYS